MDRGEIGKERLGGGGERTEDRGWEGEIDKIGNNTPISIPPSLELLLRQLQERFPDKPSPNIKHCRRYLPAFIPFFPSPKQPPHLLKSPLHAPRVANINTYPPRPTPLLLDLLHDWGVIVRVPRHEDDGVLLGEFARDGGAGAGAYAGDYGGGGGADGHFAVGWGCGGGTDVG